MDFITEIQLKGTINNPLTNIVYCFKFFCNKNILVTQQSVKAGNETGGAAHLPLFSLRATLYCNTFWRRKKMWYSYYFSKVILQKQGYIIPYGWDRVAKQIPRSLLPLFPWRSSVHQDRCAGCMVFCPKEHLKIYVCKSSWMYFSAEAIWSTHFTGLAFLGRMKKQQMSKTPVQTKHLSNSQT